MGDLSGKVVFITGASSGLGEHFAQILAADGAHVILAARRLDRVEALAGTIVAQGGRATPTRLDVTDERSISDAMAILSEPLHILVNNAGITGEGPALEMPYANFANVVDTNLIGVFAVAQAAARRMAADGGGAIVNVASIVGIRVAGQIAAYAASKAGVIHLTKALALEWARHGIRVNALCPGYVETPLNAPFFASDAGKSLIQRIPQRRLGRLDELDAPMRLLCSDGASYITGSILSVDGGHLCSTL